MSTNAKLGRSFLWIASLVVAIGGCASNIARPLAFIGIYGDYAGDWAAVSRIVERHGFESKRMTVDPPTGIEGSIIIHGRSNAAQIAASLIADDLGQEFGIRFEIQPANVGNHSYSDNYLGIYVMAGDYADFAAEKFRKSHTIIPSNEFLAQCDQFAGSLILLPGGRFNLSGERFDKSDTARVVSVAGEYSRSNGQLDLRLQNSSRRYSETEVKSARQSVARTLFRVLNAEPVDNSILDCNFLQDLAVNAKR